MNKIKITQDIYCIKQDHLYVKVAIIGLILKTKKTSNNQFKQVIHFKATVMIG